MARGFVASDCSVAQQRDDAGPLMMQTSPDRGQPPAPDRSFRSAVLFVAILTALRIAAQFATPLELYPDEAQYWSWSRDLAFGYFSKPPLIAWLILLSSDLGGDVEPRVRLSAPLLHAGAALALQRAGARLYDGRVGFWAAVVYSLMPGVQLSAGVIATDAPLLLFLSLGLWAYAAWAQRPGPVSAAALGAALAGAILSKYAGAYFLAGLAAHALVDRQVRGTWRASHLAIVAGTCLAMLAPHLAWNATHGFVTVGHVAANTGWLPAADAPPSAEPLVSLDWRQTPGFLLSQFGVFGPIPFAVLVLGAATSAVRRRLAQSDRLLLAFILPPLAVVVGEALVARANANWAAAAYAPGSILVAAFLARWNARGWLRATVAVQGAFAALFLLVAVRPTLLDAVGLSNSLKRARGWAVSTRMVLDQAKADGTVSAIAVDDRFLFNAMSYYGRKEFARPGAAPLRMWMRRPWANTQAEAAAPLRPAESRRVLAASLDDVYLDEMRGDFVRTSPSVAHGIRLDPKRRRRISIFVGEGLHPAPRDPRTGLPIRSASPTTTAPVERR
jgi:4-amino-4-deoxy-L-arabinose transferase-like glycosyltransferase